jgi:hypothetical protein
MTSVVGRLLLALYPRGFRRRHGDEFLEALAERFGRRW